MTAQPRRGGLPPGVIDGAHRRTTVGLLLLVTFVAFEAMAVATAMPTAVADLSGLAWYGWAFTAFLVAQVVGMVLGGDLGDRRGPRAALLWGAGTFAVGLLVAGTAVDMAVMISGPTSAGSTQAAEIAPNSRGRNAASYACPATT